MNIKNTAVIITLACCALSHAQGEPFLYQEELNLHYTLVNDALQRAVQRGNIKAAQSALTLGAQVNYADKQGTTPLMIAAQNADIAMLLLLLEAGAQPTFLQENGFTINYYQKKHPTKKALPVLHALRNYIPEK